MPNNANLFPVTDHITMEDPGQSIGASLTTLVAVQAFAEASVIREPESTRPAHPTTTSQPNPKYFTMEDGGQSDGASVTSLRAAHLLASLKDLDNEAPKFPARPSFRPCDGKGYHCC